MPSTAAEVAFIAPKPNAASDALPRLLPAPGPTETASAAEALQPDFDRTGRPYWADEQTHRDTGESHG
ncbi:hypothetical protein ACUY1T_07945 [Billgrantia sp. Q4P2]|uniref:hypothetical protein n=1 Tax=Billgrantia sp. Q4P2 TaxID=3463857 RepID=UPI004056EEB3